MPRIKTVLSEQGLKLAGLASFLSQLTRNGSVSRIRALVIEEKLQLVVTFVISVRVIILPGNVSRCLKSKANTRMSFGTIVWRLQIGF